MLRSTNALPYISYCSGGHSSCLQAHDKVIKFYDNIHIFKRINDPAIGMSRLLHAEFTLIEKILSLT
jgi:hypothetical protein